MGFFQNIENGSRSAGENHYAESAGLSERPAEEQSHLTETPPLPPTVSESVAQDTSASPHQVTDNGAGDPTFASVPARTAFGESADSGSCTLPTADSDAGDPTERPAEEHPPPLPPRLMDDGASTPHSADQSTPDQVTSDNGAGDPTYAPILTTTPNAVSQPAATERVSYEDIQKYQNEQVWFSHICR